MLSTLVSSLDLSHVYGSYFNPPPPPGRYIVGDGDDIPLGLVPTVSPLSEPTPESS